MRRNFISAMSAAKRLSVHDSTISKWATEGLLKFEFRGILLFVETASLEQIKTARTMHGRQWKSFIGEDKKQPEASQEPQQMSMIQEAKPAVERKTIASALRELSISAMDKDAKFAWKLIDVAQEAYQLGL